MRDPWYSFDYGELCQEVGGENRVLSEENAVILIIVCRNLDDFRYKLQRYLLLYVNSARTCRNQQSVPYVHTVTSTLQKIDGAKEQTNMLPFQPLALLVLLGISRIASGVPVAQFDLDVEGDLSANDTTSYTDSYGDLEYDLSSLELDLGLDLGLDLELKL